MSDFIKAANEKLDELDKLVAEKETVDYDGRLRTGVDLGTANLVVTVVDEDGEPIIGASKSGKVVRDGLVVDYIKAINIIRKLKEELELRLNRGLNQAATAVPPGTGSQDINTFENVVAGAGFEVIDVVDEPSAAASALKMETGVVVDIGGGTTGISILEEGEVVYTADEATGGTHLDLVIAGNLGIEIEEAEKIKEDPSRSAEILPMVVPVIEKIATIINNHIRNYDVDKIYLVGGTSSIPGIEKVLKKRTGLEVIKPSHPLLVTPLGIAMNC